LPAPPAEEVLAAQSPAEAAGAALQHGAAEAEVPPPVGVQYGPPAVEVQYGLPGVGAAAARYA
jgi:hypothetical protein